MNFFSVALGVNEFDNSICFLSLPVDLRFLFTLLYSKSCGMVSYNEQGFVAGVEFTNCLPGTAIE